MNLYLTGADNSLIDTGGNSPQDNPNLSLGGFFSSSFALSGNLNEVFDLITNFVSEEEKTETFCFGLKNDLQDVENLTIKVLTSDKNLGKYKVGISEFDDILFTEKIKDKYHIPQSVSFVNADLYKAYVDVKIENLASVGEEFTIMPFDVICTVKEFNYDGVFNALANGFKNSGGLYSVKRFDEKNFRIERNDDTVETFECELVTTDSLQLSFSKDFGNEVNNSFLAKSSFPESSLLGIWITRSIEKEIMNNEELLSFYENKGISEKIEETELIISYNIPTLP